GNKVHKLELGYGRSARHRKSNRKADDRSFVERAVPHPRAAKLIVQPARDSKDAAILAYIFAEHHDARVTRHFLANPFGNRLSKSQDRHGEVPDLRLFTDKGLPR